MRKIAVLLLITFMWAGSTYAADGVVSLNFENWGGAPTGASPTAGVVDVPYWNDTWLDNQKNSPMTDLRDSTGATTTVDVAWASGGEYGVNLWNDTGADDDGRLNVSVMKGFIDANQNQTPDTCTVDISEIPYKYYDLYVYIMSDTQNRLANVTDGTTTYYLLTDPQSLHFSGDPLSADYVDFKQATATDSGSAVNSNYVVFSGLSGSSQQIVSYCQQGGGIPAIQIVEIAGLVAPSEGKAIPENEDGTVGTVNIPDLTVTNVDLTFKAGQDPNFTENGLLVNPDIDSYIIRLQTGAPTDPNLRVVDALAEAGQSTTDPNRLFPLSGYQSGLAYGKLKSGTTYEWQVEQVMINPDTLLAYGVGDPNNLFSSVFSFTTASATPEITSDPYHMLIDKVTGEAELTFSASAVADNFRWYKVGREAALTDSEIDGVTYAGTDTTTLTVSGMAADGSEDAQYYAVAYNGVPGGETTQASEPTATVWVWYPREVNHYNFENTYIGADGNDFITDSISGFDGQLKSNDTGDDLPTIDPNTVFASGNSLLFNNPRVSDPNHVDAQYVQMNDPWIGWKDITISAWIYWNGGGTWQRIIDLGNTTANHINFQVNPGWPASGPNGLQLELIVNGNADSRVYSPANAIPVGEWVYVTATVSEDSAKLFVNGEWVATDNTFPADPINIGPALANYLSYSRYGGDWFNGYMDDLRIWNYGLSNEDVAQEYMDVKGGWICDNENYDLPYDYNDDCITNLNDFAIFAAEWMDNYRIYPEL